MARVMVTWLGQPDKLNAPVIQFGNYELPLGEPVEIGDDLIIAPELTRNGWFRVETIED